MVGVALWVLLEVEEGEEPVEVVQLNHFLIILFMSHLLIIHY